MYCLYERAFVADCNLFPLIIVAAPKRDIFVLNHESGQLWYFLPSELCQQKKNSPFTKNIKSVNKLLFQKEIFLCPESWIMAKLIIPALLYYLSPAQNVSHLSKSVSSGCLPFTMHSKLGSWCQKRNLKVSNNCAAVLTI